MHHQRVLEMRHAMAAEDVVGTNGVRGSVLWTPERTTKTIMHQPVCAEGVPCLM